ncbi:uncharacterized protein LOC126891536 [Diabrotica virgifera virgifera]|uniref:Uncharacterized protein n=1 Tax=Diabrotica virgifera virgifera TaxID=50390 RepID=A0ABM5L2L1_DIAVI|nr:uncharacterized protein LOC126891536 [Diabrotica virgifera virgifera]
MSQDRRQQQQQQQNQVDPRYPFQNTKEDLRDDLVQDTLNNTNNTSAIPTLQHNDAIDKEELESEEEEAEEENLRMSQDRRQQQQQQQNQVRPSMTPFQNTKEEYCCQIVFEDVYGPYKTTPQHRDGWHLSIKEL